LLAREWYPLTLKSICSAFRWPKNPFAMSLKTPSHSLLINVVQVSGDEVVCCQWDFFFSFLLKNYSLVFFIIGISTLVLILLIFYFCFWSFCKKIIFFQFHHSILIFHALFFKKLILIRLISISFLDLL
jgi:hypothetical protein